MTLAPVQNLPTSGIRSMTTTTITTCTPRETKARIDAGEASVIDVRTPAEFRAVHAEGATPVPLDRFDPAAVVAGAPAGRSIHLICRSGARACQAAQRLADAGHSATVVEGGTDAWIAAGLPVVRGRSAISLERQVRIGAGLLVVCGVVLGFTIHPYWFGLSGFVGAGLTVAGITDTCMMGMVIARMPWNR